MSRRHSTPPPLDTVLDGEVMDWRDDKGFGFIRYDSKKSGVFFHISAFAYHHRRPQPGDAVSFKIQEKDGRYSASRVVLSQDRQQMDSDSVVDNKDLPPHIAEAVIFAMLSLFFYLSLTYLSLPLALSSFIISILTYTLYRWDKHAALHNKQRIPEASLHIATLLGGWPGALIARALMRHKTKKLRYVVFFWMSIVIYFAALYAIVLLLPQHLDHFNTYFANFIGL